MRSRIYIAGPISAAVPKTDREGRPIGHLTVEEKINRFHEAKGLLAALDLEPVSPIDVGNDDCVREDIFEMPPCIKPGETPNGQGDHSWECYMRHDLKALLTCSAICLLPNWSGSRGARLEFRVAKDLEFGTEFTGLTNEGRLHLL